MEVDYSKSTDDRLSPKRHGDVTLPIFNI